MAEYHIIQEGYSSLENGLMKANATCILVMTPANTIIVDTLTPWDSEVIKKSNIRKHVYHNGFDFRRDIKFMTC